MKFILNRNRTLATTMGHTIEFRKGEPTHVPPECRAEVIAIGAVSETELEDDLKPEHGRPVDPLAVEAAVFEAFEKLVLKNDSKEFTAAGLPHPKALERILGWRIDAGERDTLWAKFNQRDKD